MIYVICPRCRTKHLKGTECPNQCSRKNKKEANRVYDKYQRKNAEFYHSREWLALRDVCNNKYDNICLYSFFKYHEIVKSKVVHHIIELEDDRTQALSIDNLIPVSQIAHAEIHARYRKNKEEVQKELYEMKRQWEMIYKG